MLASVTRNHGKVPGDAIKIGAVARHFGVSVDLLRLYEREGLLIPMKSQKGTRYFGERDFLWIGTILRLVREARLNFAGIRRLLALLPCWEVRQCPYPQKQQCPVLTDASSPCWANRSCACANGAQDCYACAVYRSAPSCENLKALLAVPTASQTLVPLRTYF
jgi:MerR family transcriptional regulator/heat shock protein HspR